MVMQFYIGQTVQVEYVDSSIENGIISGTGRLIKYLGKIEWLIWSQGILHLLKIKRPDGVIENVNPLVVKGYKDDNPPRFYHASKWTQTFVNGETPTCSCPAFIYCKTRPKTCKHIKLLIEKGVENG